MAVLLADGRYRVRRRPHPWPRDAHGAPVPAADTEVTDPLAGAAARQPDGSWRLRLDPSAWPVLAGDVVERGDGMRWIVSAAARRIAVPGAPDADYVAVTAGQEQPDADQGHTGVDRGGT